MTADAHVQTTKGSRYLQALCGHFSRKVKADYNAEQGLVDFGFASCAMRAEAEVLVLQVEAPDAEGLGRVKEVVGGHLERCTAKDALKVQWTDTHILEDARSGEVA